MPCDPAYAGRRQVTRLFRCYFVLSRLIVLKNSFSNTGSVDPRLIFLMKYFSNATFAKCTHLPFEDQLMLRGGI